MSRPLRVFLCCQQDLRLHPIPSYRFWAEYFRNALEEAGVVCLEAPDCDWAEGLTPQSEDALRAWRSATWQRAVDWVKREHARSRIDLFLAYLFPQQVEPGALAELRATGIPSVNFFCDNIREFRRVPSHFAAFDLNWVPEAEAVALYREASLSHIHAPMPCWVPQSFRTPPSEETLPASFVGTCDELRRRLFAKAIAAGLDVELRGQGWLEEVPSPPRGTGGSLLKNQWSFAERHGWAALARKLLKSAFPDPPVAFDFGSQARPAPDAQDYWRVLRESRVSIGVSRFPSPRHSFRRPGRYSRLRDIEAPMAGACYLAEWAPGLEELYDIGKEVETYREADELAAKVAELSRDAGRRQRLRAAGQRRALSDHTVARTLEKIAQRLGLPHIELASSP